MNHGVRNLLVFFGAQLLAGAAVGVYDVYMEYRFGGAGTISGTMRNLGLRYPLVPFIVGSLYGFLLGVLGGHFWGVPAGGR